MHQWKKLVATDFTVAEDVSAEMDKIQSESKRQNLICPFFAH